MATDKNKNVIRFQAHSPQIKTLIDGGANVTLSLGADEIDAMTQLLEVRRHTGIILEVAIVPIQVKENLKNAAQDEHDNHRTRKRRRYPYKD